MHIQLCDKFYFNNFIKEQIVFLNYICSLRCVFCELEYQFVIEKSRILIVYNEQSPII